MPVTREILDEIALSEAEYRLIVDRLDREPNPVELGMFGALWSEHCGYNHSRTLLRLFPAGGPRVLFPPGQENAGAVDIGDGLAVVFKIESHNHPSAVEPFQGAATGVGGIVRDVMAMGARPIALLNSLRFGPLEDPHNRHLFDGVVEGISWYGNCIGVPDVGGEVVFSPCYSRNPLVNALCVGLIEKDRLVRSSVGEEGNLLLLVGAETGRDGIHGASGLASRTFEEEREMRPTVQVGNPFMEKVLIEACLEAAATGCLEGMQDLGAAGLTSATVEAASKSGAGIDLDVSRVHRRDSGLGPYEVLLSESQERMILVVASRRKATVEAIFRKWEIPCIEIGRVTDIQAANVFEGTERVAQLPLDVLTDPPSYRLKGVRPRDQVERQRYPLGSLPLPSEGPAEMLLQLLGSPNIASKESVYRQYDHQVQTNTALAPGSDAAVLRVKGTGKGIALCTDGNGRYCYLDPYRGGSIAVAEACRNLSCVGAEPIALTDCLNFGNPENPETYYQLEWCIRGMARACRALGGAGGQRKRQPVQRDPGPGHLPDPGGGGVGFAPGRGTPYYGRLRGGAPGGPAGSRRGEGPDRRPGGQRVPGADPRPDGRQAHHRPRPRGEAAAALPPRRRREDRELGPRLLRRRPGRRPGGELHRRRRGFRRRFPRQGPVGRGPLRGSPVQDRGVPSAGGFGRTGGVDIGAGCAPHCPRGDHHRPPFRHRGVRRSAPGGVGCRLEGRARPGGGRSVIGVS